MKKVAKFALIIILIFILLLLSSCIGMFTSLESRDVYVLNDTKYHTIEDLHQAYCAHYESDTQTDYYPRDMVMYFCKDNNVFVVSTYSTELGGAVYEDVLWVYIAKQDADGYYIELPKADVIEYAKLYLHDDYVEIADKWYYTEHRRKNEDLCYAFVYKSKDEPINLYFDGVKMDETICINPFTQEEFILCYATSNKTYSTLECLVIPMEKRHTLEVKQQED